jgi:prevent-host-death family protein
MTTHVVNTHEAKTRLSELIREVENGQDVILARNGRPVAKLIAWPPGRPQRTPGAWAGRVQYHTDIVGPDEEVASMFEHSAQAPPP